MADIMSQPSVSQQPPVCFLDLSAELRNQIYRLSLCADLQEGENIELGVRHGSSTCTGVLFRNGEETQLDLAPGILGTCKQVYAEASSILYGENTFAMAPTAFLKSMGRVPFFTSQVRLLEIDYTTEWETLHFYSPLPRSWMNAVNPSYSLALTLRMLEALPKLRTLLIKSDIRLDCIDKDEDMEITAQRIAKCLHPVVESIMVSQKGVRLNVRGALKFCFRLARSFKRVHIRTPMQQVRQLKEVIYEELEATLN